ncbi:MAG: hypothetical protein LBM66_03820 [Bifidobacteriaceae bacterium]|nr:hypothetical protein [Bifidobacteriaceae bacterium]
MRVYVPGTAADLRRGTLASSDAYAVTPALEAALPEDVAETREYVAYLGAVDDSAQLAAAVGAVPRRVVFAAEVATSAVRQPESEPDAGGHPGLVRLRGPVAWRDVVAIHVDETAAEPDVTAAANGDSKAARALEDRDLMWYDPSERDALIHSL